MRKREPLEVQIVDVFTGNKIVGEYRGENKKIGPAKLPVYKVYSPFFGDGLSMTAFRWVNRIKVLGPAPTAEDMEKFLQSSEQPAAVEETA